MSWSKFDLRNSICRLLGRTAASPFDREEGIEEARAAMLSLLGDARTGRSLHVLRCIRCAALIEDLWYLRGDLMVALTELNGAAAAREEIAGVTAQFRGLLPKGFNSRFSTLGD